MTHQPYFDWIHATLDGDLRPEQRRQLEEHLAACAECTTLWEALDEVDRLFKAEPMVAPRSGFTGRFKARLAQQRSRPRMMWGALALGLSAIGAAALVLPLGVGFISSAVRVAQQPAASAALFGGFNATAAFASTIVEALFTLLRVFVSWAVVNPLMWAAGLSALALTGVWLYLMRKLNLEVSFR